MSQLSQVAQATRNIVKFGLIGLTAYILTIASLKFCFNLWKKLFPPPPPPPTVAFGKLPKIDFPAAASRNFSYILETPTGNLPLLPDRETVYALPPKRASLLGLDKAKSLAKEFGFLKEPTQTSPGVYRFAKELPALLTLDYNLVDNSFVINYQWQSDEEILTNKLFLSDPLTIKTAGQILNQAGLMTPDLETGKTTISYLKAKANTMVPVFSLSEADFVKVDFFRAETQKTPNVTPFFTTGNVSFIFSGNEEKYKQIVRLDYNYFPVDLNSFGTYPLKPVMSAWEELKNNQAHIAQVKENAKETIAIRRVYLAYYDAEKYQPYFQPVYVFEGDENFSAYVPAISPEWVIDQ